MKNDPDTMLDRCDTLMLDMDGTLLDLAYDNFMWLTHVPRCYAERHGLSLDEATRRFLERADALRGRLDWYCLDQWSDHLGLDVVALHRDENHRIGYLPGAESFLRRIRERDMRIVMVTNSHLETLDVKDEVTGVRAHFDRIYTSHEFGHPKEDQPFWEALREEEGFDPATTLFVDDNHDVLGSAATFGIGMLLAITRPDTSRPRLDSGRFRGISGVADLLGALDRR